MASAIEYGTVIVTPPPKQRQAQSMRYMHRAFGDAPKRGKGVWLGIGGLLLSAGLMVAIGFTKPVSYRRRRHS